MRGSSRPGGRRIPAAVAGTAAGMLAVASLPWWLPDRVVALRMWLFARINGDEGIPVPGPLVGVEHFKQVYSHPAANGRSRGAALSDLFWYWLSPGAEIHQEHLEPGERYEEVARTTRRILSMPTEQVEELATRYTAEACSENGRLAGKAGSRLQAVRLRDLMMPIWAGVFSEVVFGERCSPTTRDLIVANADDVVTALKCCSLRHMDRRHRLTRFLADHLDQVMHDLPTGLSHSEQALYLQGTFFNTAVVQMSEAMAHLLMVLAQHPALQAELAAHPEDRRRLDHVVDEAMRLYPLFGIAHRITSDEIEVDERTTLPAGSVLCFNYPEFHKTGFSDPETFDPERWDGVSAKDTNHIPFGVPANRPCPAWHLAPIAMRAATRESLRHFALYTSAGHTRSIPNRGPCLLGPRHSPEPGPQSPGPPPEPRPARTPRTPGAQGPHLQGPGQSPRGTRPWRLEMALSAMRVRDRWEDVWRSLVQLVLGTYMVWDARRQRLCQRYFNERTGSSGPDGERSARQGEPARGAPFR